MIKKMLLMIILYKFLFVIIIYKKYNIIFQKVFKNFHKDIKTLLNSIILIYIINKVKIY